MTRTLGLRQVVTSSGVAIMASLCCIGELEQVVDGADHRPLGSDLVEATEEELAEASCMLDLAEHRLDDLLSEKGKIFVVAVSGVGRDFLGIGTQHRADVGEERDQRVGVRGAGLQAWRCR